VLGRHNIYNSLAGIAVGIALGLDIPELIKGVEAFTGDGSRQNIYMHGDIRIFDDTYNASPASMKASMSVFGALKGDKTLVLADMLELGDLSVSSHKELADAVYATGAKRVVCVGDLMKNLYDVLCGVEKYSVKTGADALPVLLDTVKKGDCVFFKGSNSMNLAKLVNDFKGEWKNDN
jgi:UDP-N-acetylmuramoyl-tripeptide--D-alanyl-D-alanine ligase